MKKILFLFIVLTSISKAQNDSITFFAYTDNNNNCLYEPGMGEQPVTNFSINFRYMFSSSNTQLNTKSTNDTGYVTFHVFGAMAPATNTIEMTPCVYAPPVSISSCFITQDLIYNTTYSIPIYSPLGLNGFIKSIFNGVAINANTLNNIYCIGAPQFSFDNFGSYNYLTGSQPVVNSMTLSIAGGSTYTSQYLSYIFACTYITGGGSATPFLNPEFHLPGIYTATITIQGLNAPNFSSVLNFAVDSCSLYTGQVYVDCNSNCTKDVNEFNCDEEVITVTNGTYSTTVIPDYNGNYSIISPFSSLQYTASISPNIDFALSCSTPSTVIYYANSFSSNFSPNIFNQTTANNINYFSFIEHPYSGSSVPGGHFMFNSYYGVEKPDFCSLVNDSGNYFIKLDPNLQLDSFDVLTPYFSGIYPTSSGDSIVWDFQDLRQFAMNLGGNKFVLYLSMLTSAPIGQPYTISSGVTSKVIETTLLDNNTFGSWLIGGPFDPNFLEVTPKGTGNQGYISTNTTELYYTINFQNVGTSPAISVRVKNLLDGDLEKNSLKIIGSSAPVQTNIDGNGMATFLFEHILLADSSYDEPNSHGFVTYKINLKPGLVAGTQFTNNASIYFDYNSPVITNTTINTLQSTLGLQDLTESHFSLYPNPSKGIITINSTEVIVKVSVINVLGEVMQISAFDSKNATINITDLKSGVYFLHVTDVNNQIGIKKIIKE